MAKSSFWDVWKFHFALFRLFPKLFSSALDIGKALIAAPFFFILLFNEELGKKLMNWEAGINRLWSLVPIGAVFLHLLLKANYNRFLAEAGVLKQFYDEAMAAFEGFEDKLREKDRRIEELQEQLAPKLRIVFEPNEHRHRISEDTILYRIGVKNTGTRTISRVSVRVKDIHESLFSLLFLLHGKGEGELPPPDLSYLRDVPLKLKHDRSQPPKQEFSLDGGQHQDIDVLQKQKNSPQIEICHAIDLNRIIKAGPYTITIVVYGQDIPPVERTFDISTDWHGNLQFRSR